MAVREVAAVAEPKVPAVRAQIVGIRKNIILPVAAVEVELVAAATVEQI